MDTILCSEYSNGTEFSNNNCSVISSENSDSLKQVFHGHMWTPAVIQRIATLSVIMTLTLCGNLFIIVALSCSKLRKYNTRVNIFIINLSVGDLTVCCFTMTTEVLFVVFDNAWVMGAVACKILLYVQIITLASTTFILVAMSYDRYMALCKPLSLGTNRARKMIIISWVMAFVFASPQLFIFKQVSSGIYPDGEIMYKCKSMGYTAWWQRKLYFTFMTMYILIIPAVIISFCYINVARVVWAQGKDIKADKDGECLRKTIRKDCKSIHQSKIKSIKMTLSIICSFIFCWTPYFVVHLLHIWSEYNINIPAPVYVFAETMALLNSALNPILYGCFNVKIKRELYSFFCPHRLRTIDTTIKCSDSVRSKKANEINTSTRLSVMLQVSSKDRRLNCIKTDADMDRTNGINVRAGFNNDKPKTETEDICSVKYRGIQGHAV